MEAASWTRAAMQITTWVFAAARPSGLRSRLQPANRFGKYWRRAEHGERSLQIGRKAAAQRDRVGYDQRIRFIGRIEQTKRLRGKRRVGSCNVHANGARLAACF